jgi:hypothetical protein
MDPAELNVEADALVNKAVGSKMTEVIHSQE